MGFKSLEWKSLWCQPTCLKKTKKHLDNPANGAVKDETFLCSLNLSALLYVVAAARSMEWFPIGKDPLFHFHIFALSPLLSTTVFLLYLSALASFLRDFLIFFFPFHVSFSPSVSSCQFSGETSSPLTGCLLATPITTLKISLLFQENFNCNR